MNADRVPSDWKQLKGKLKQRWGNLTDDDLGTIAGRRDQLLGKIQLRHGLSREEAEEQAKEFDALLRGPTPH